MKGSEMTLAHWLARKAIKAQWRAQGRKVHYIEAAQLAKAASAYLSEHRAELLEQAGAYLRTFERNRRR
jgi:hypothetical protein